MDNDIVPIIVAVVMSSPGWFAFFGNIIDKREARKAEEVARKAKVVADEIVEAKKAAALEKERIYKEVANELALKHELQANGLADRVDKLEDKLTEIITLLGKPKTRGSNKKAVK